NASLPNVVLRRESEQNLIVRPMSIDNGSRSVSGYVLRGRFLFGAGDALAHRACQNAIDSLIETLPASKTRWRCRSRCSFRFVGRFRRRRERIVVRSTQLRSDIPDGGDPIADVEGTPSESIAFVNHR